MTEFLNWIQQFLIFVAALLVVLTIHEAAHAAVAYYLGDPTAKLAGRLSLNPIRHLDPVGSIVFLVTQKIGWGKPVPVNSANFKNPLRDDALVALAGPLSNFILAFLIAIPLRYMVDVLSFENEVIFSVRMLLWMTFHVSIFLGIFNLFPFPPLDGSKILGLFVPARFEKKYEKFLNGASKYFIAIILVDVFILSELIGFSVFGSVMRFLHDIVMMVLLLGT